MERQSASKSSEMDWKVQREALLILPELFSRNTAGKIKILLAVRRIFLLTVPASLVVNFTGSRRCSAFSVFANGNRHSSNCLCNPQGRWSGSYQRRFKENQ